jgi:hypothetical protein
MTIAMSIKPFLIGFTGLILSTAALSPAFALPESATQSVNNATVARDGSTDFDFLYGAHWHVHNRRLQQRMAGSQTWVEFDANDEFQALPGGIGNEEHYRTGFWKDYVGIGLHMYNRKAATWSLYWVDNHSLPGVLQPPVIGTFSNGVGIFEGPDEFDGKPITVRFTWKNLGKGHAYWEQAFSGDGGKSWETNWTMDFTR